MRWIWALGLSLAACSSNGSRGVGDMLKGLDGFLGGPPDGSAEKPTDFAGIDLPPTYAQIYAHTGQTLYTFDPTAPSASQLSLVGDFGVSDDMTDLAVTPDGKVYTVSRTTVYTVDAASGQATKLADGISSSMVALTFRLDGTLLSSDQNGNVYIIDPATAKTTKLGSFGSGYDTAGDLVAIADGTMFGVSTMAPDLPNATTNVLVQVNTSTAKAKTVGEIGYSGVFGVAYSGGHVLAFTKTGQIIEIDPMTGAGTLLGVKNDQSTGKPMVFYGAGTSPLVPIN